MTDCGPKRDPLCLTAEDKSPYERRFDRYDPKFKNTQAPGVGVVPFFRQLLVSVLPTASNQRVDIGDAGEVSLWSDRVLGIAIENPNNYQQLRQLHVRGRVRTLWFNGNGSTTALVMVYFANPDFGSGFERYNPRWYTPLRLHTSALAWNAASATTQSAILNLTSVGPAYLMKISLQRTAVGDLRRFTMVDQDNTQTIIDCWLDPTRETWDIDVDYLPLPVSVIYLITGSTETVATTVNVLLIGTAGV